MSQKLCAVGVSHMHSSSVWFQGLSNDHTVFCYLDLDCSPSVLPNTHYIDVN